MKKLVSLVTALVLVMTMCTACAQTAPATQSTAPAASAAATESKAATAFDPSKYPVAIAMDNKNHPVHRIVQLGFLKAAEKLGYKAQVIGTEGSDANEVYSAIDAFAATGGKGIMVWRGDDTCFPTLKKLAAQDVKTGIAHFKFDPMPDGLNFNMACDPVAYGKLCADFIAKKIEGKKGTIAVTQNTKNNTENAATNAFTEQMNSKKLEGITVLPVELEGGDIATATTINASIIQKNKDLIAAFGTTGNSPVTWSDAAAKAGKAKGELIIVGMDYTEANLAKIESGEVAAIIAQPLYDEAFKTMEYFDKMFRGETVEKWTALEAPIVYKGGSGSSDPDHYREILKEVKTWFK